MRKPIDRLLPVSEVLRTLSIGRTAWYSGIRDGRFPRGVMVTPQRRAWRESEIRKLLASLQPAEVRK